MDAAAQFEAAFAAHKAGDLAAAERGYRAATASEDHLPSLNNLGVLLADAGRFEEAGHTYRRAAEAAPASPKMLAAYANHLREVRDFPAAEVAYRRLLAMAPEFPHASFILGCVLLAQGRFEEGWRRYQHREPRHDLMSKLGSPEWRGESLAGKRLFIWREQGFGDQIMMARFLGSLDAGRVIYAGPPQLQRLFAGLPVEFVRSDEEAFVVPPHDCWTMPLSLPHHLGVTAQTVPTAAYLFGTAKDASPTAARPRIGVVWRGEPRNRNDRFRSLPQDQAQRLLALPGAVSLDPADTGAADFQETADLIAALDLVIAVDTAAAHLAGAMGKPVWVLAARYALDWQWPREGDSPWYPSARVFTQPSAGDWAGVIDAVIAELSAEAAS